LMAQANQEYPFEELVEELNLVRDSSRNPLFDVVFSLQNIDEIHMEAEGLKFNDININGTISKFDLTVTLTA
ncbi:TPA: hypothetical protein QCW90_005719, partial [Bacillus mobilis]|nr:hypothetical protein [Bacillus mobilis]